MTGQTRIERELPSILGDLAMGPTPDYIDDVLGRTVRMRQRPAWMSLERWIPMADIASRPAFVPRLPSRAVGMALIVLALLLALAVALVGTRQTKLPAPFGVARNGLMAYEAGGDIYALDSATGLTTALVSGPEIDQLPMFSRDGTRLAFFRLTGTTGTGASYDLVVANADGTGQRVISTDPVTFDFSINWSADGRAIVLDDIKGHVTRLDAVGSAAPEKITYPEARDIVALRPPSESQLLYRTVTAKGWTLQVIDADGTDAHPLMTSDDASLRPEDYRGYSWSPDGSKVAFLMHPDTSDDMRIYIVNADGTGLHRLTHETGAWCECDMFWSPDGTQIAMNRWQVDPATGEWHGSRVAIATVDDGTVRDIGPMPPGGGGAEFAFSPDGASLLWWPRATDDAGSQSYRPIVLDIATGTDRTVDVSIDSGPDWQRLAP